MEPGMNVRRAVLGLLSMVVGLGLTLLLLEVVLRVLPVPNTGAVRRHRPRVPRQSL